MDLKMNLFKCEDGFNVEIDPKIFLVTDFNALYHDRNGLESLIIKELAYVYFMEDIESDFQQEGDPVERAFDVRKHVNLPLTWKADEFIENCQKTYSALSETMTSGLLKDTNDMVFKIRKELKAINLSDKDAAGKPIYNLKQIIETTKLIPALIEALSKAEMEYVRGKEEVNKNKGSKKKSAYEDM
jgi:hypothetical protein